MRVTQPRRHWLQCVSCVVRRCRCVGGTCFGLVLTCACLVRSGACERVAAAGMELLLVEALLSHCRDPSTLLRELSGGREAGPLPPGSADRLETLRLVLRRLSERWIPGAAGRPLERAVQDLALQRCLPLLGRLGAVSRADELRLIRALCGALRHCVEICGLALAAQVAAAAVRDLEQYGGLGTELQPGDGGMEPHHGRLGTEGAGTEPHHGRLSAEGAVEALGAVLPSLLDASKAGGDPQRYRPLVERILCASLALLRSGTDEVAALLAGRLMPVLGADAVALQVLWDGLCLGEEDVGLESWGSERLMLLLSSVCEQLLPEVGSPRTALQPRLCCSFWRAVQRGLTCADSLTRKRALYLLRKALHQQPSYITEEEEEEQSPHEPRLFWWSCKKKEEFTQFWENYILIMETLEGNQIHVIRPVFPKLNYLFELAVAEEKGCWLFHPSWHLCIYERMLKSENKTLVREGVVHFLELYETSPPPGSLRFCDFILGPLLDAISESSLFSRSQGQLIGACPPLGLKLENFLARFIASLPEQNQGCFLFRFIHKMTSRHWCAVPILFLSKALALIPACRLWGGEGLLALRKVLQCTMSTHEILLRGAAQCYLLQAAMNLTDIEKVSHGEVASFLMALNSEESLCRGTMLWKEVCEWLYANDHCFRQSSSCDLHPDRLLLSIYVQGLVEDYLRASATEGESSPVPDWFEANLVATMILIAADVDEMKSKVNDKSIMEWKELKCFLNPLLDSLIKLSTNPYLPTLKTDKSLQLLLKLLQNASLKSSSTLNEGGLLMCLWTYIIPSAPNILEFVLRRLTNEIRTVSDLDRCNLYLAVLSELVNLSSTIASKRGISFWSFIFSLTSSSIHTLQKTSNEQEPKLEEQIQKVVGMASLAWVCEIVSHADEKQLEYQDVSKKLVEFVSSIHLNRTLKKPTWNEEKSSELDELSSSQGWGKIVARYVHDQWVCVHFILQKYQDLIVTSEDPMTEQSLPIVQKPVTTLQNALDALNILPSDQVLPVFHCMKILVPKLLNSAEPLCIQSINSVWKVVSSLCNTQLIFWANLKAFVQFVFDPELLTGAAKLKGQAFLNIKEIMHHLIEMSNTKTGVFNVVMSYCCKSWITPFPGDASLSENPFLNARSYMELVTEACVFGTVFRRDQRLLQDIHAFVQNLGDDCSANIATESTSKDEHYVRVCAIKFLCWLDGSSASHKAFLEDIVLKLLDKDELVSKSKIRYYANSLQHRVKNRLWQTLLILFPKLDQNFVNKIVGRIFMAGFSNNQGSVKYLIEWLLILILNKYPQILPRFWDCFCCTEEKVKTSICTFLAVLIHFDTVIQATSEKLLLLKKALIVVLQWCFNHNFSVRLYALMALKKLWSMSKELSMDEFETLAAVIESSLHQVETMQGAGNAKKNWQKIQEHFFFSTFHPLEDYSIETIFHTLPSLSEVVEEEWIPASKFANFRDIPLDSAFKLFNSRPELHDLTPSDWSQQDIGFNSAEVDTQPEWADVQKKIIPLKNRISDLDLEMVCLDRAAKLVKSNGSLIVVASLIDKPANLGGLCRTSEIFGASALVVDSLHYVNDKQFQYLSVSSEQWLPLVEVKPPHLVDYLQQKKTEGYTIIGVEQTAKSADLTEYIFPEKSLLLLGNEREGIPANLIQHLDVCVEIPQQGIIRSLNVHVSGALLIWEYTKQQIMKRKSKKVPAL